MYWSKLEPDIQYIQIYHKKNIEIRHVSVVPVVGFVELPADYCSRNCRSERDE